MLHHLIKHMSKYIILPISLMYFGVSNANTIVSPADTQYESYIPLLANKRVAIFANNASQINGQNIVTVLLNKHINVVKIFSPEHGFTGSNDAGAKVTNSKFAQIPVISLYGKKEQPDMNDLSDVDVVVFDIQDVGVRYYTYISSLQKLMEALTIAHKPLIILDRPNPNAYYIDGPVLESENKSFVGMQAIPIVYGMTIGEYAAMLIGQNWLNIPTINTDKLDLTIIKMQNYTHNSNYEPPVRPSPNLPNLTSIYWYPTLGWFEGTKLSVGRGTNFPFQVLGSPLIQPTEFVFTPLPSFGSNNPPLNGQKCFGWNLQMTPTEAREKINGQIQLQYLIQSYNEFPDKNKFFTSFFDKLAGTKTLKQQIISGMSESQIRESWQPKLNQFKIIRQQYLFYP